MAITFINTILSYNLIYLKKMYTQNVKWKKKKVK